jgi:hypothetical protein
MWNMKCFVMPVVIGATGTVTRGQKIPGRNTRQTFHRLIAKNRHLGNIAHTKESATVRSLKPEWWGPPLVQGKEHWEKPVLRDDNNNNITIIIMQIYIYRFRTGMKIILEKSLKTALSLSVLKNIHQTKSIRTSDSKLTLQRGDLNSAAVSLLRYFSQPGI